MIDSTASGVAEVVGGHVGQALDLAHDVVAEVADEPAVQRRQLGQRRRAVGASSRLDRGEHALVERERRRQGAPSTVMLPVARDERGRGPPADEREPAPALACSTDSSRKPGSSPTSRQKAATGVSGRRAARATPGRRCGRAASAWNSAAGSGRDSRRGPERAVEAASAHPCGRRPCPPARRRTAACRRRSRSTPTGPTGGRPTCRPCATPPGGCGAEHRAALFERLAQRLCVHPRHHQHVAGARLLHDRGHEAVGVVADRRELLVGGGDRVTVGDEASPVKGRGRSSPLRAVSTPTAWMSRSRRMR